MGCFETKEDIPTKINKLTMLKGKMLSTIEINKVKIEGMQKNRKSRFTNKARRKRPCSK